MLAIAASLVLGTLAVGAGDDSVDWAFTISTSGEDVAWTSPTAIDPAAPTYEASYQITQLHVWVSFLSITFGPFDVTDQIPPENQSGSGSAAGPAPVLLFDGAFIAPPPPEPPTFGANLTVGLDAAGIGTLSLTEVVLGTLEVDLGFPFGVQTVQLEQVELSGTVHVDAVFDPADVNRDGAVDFADLLAVLSAWGACSGCPEDVDGSGAVDFGDLLLVLSAWS